MTTSAKLSLALVVGTLALTLVASSANANYEYRCGPHRTAMCHEEPRADESCAAYNNNCMGRCGPACGWTILGNAYTSACYNHDACIRNYMCSGYSGWQAHANCAGGLPAAVASFVQTHWNYGFQWARDTWSGLWTKVKGCCN